VSIHPDTSLGAVSLTVRNLDQSLEFYETRLGLQQNSRSGNIARLGVPGRDLIVLTEAPHTRSYPRSTGLYHFAIRVPTRFDLARSLQRILNTKTAVQGFADHLVSEAIYLPDPDGIGIEIYCDRPREEWPYENGRLKMGTDPLDLDGLFGELAGQSDKWSVLHPDTTMGHMHLHVAQLNSAEAFYHDVLGFDLVLRYGPSASFLAAGGYHHHIGINTWAGVGAPPPPADASGLRWFSIELPDDEALRQVTGRIKEAGIELVENGVGHLVSDPSSNSILLTTKFDSWMGDDCGSQT
jgi:catechol 2,3-dioxygenase